MKVAFLHAGQDPKYALKMVASVRRHMDCEILQLTDGSTQAIEGCVTVRMPWTDGNPTLFKMRHLAEISGDVLILDTDVIVQADLSPVFKLPFDVALTWRPGPIWDRELGVDVTKAMPYNCGVMFSRRQQFWHECLDWCDGKELGWYADQLAVANVSPYWNTLKLHTDNFNYTPSRQDEDVSRRLVVHYKGARKDWM